MHWDDRTALLSVSPTPLGLPWEQSSAVTTVGRLAMTLVQYSE